MASKADVPTGLNKGNREKKKPLHERPHRVTSYEEIDELFFSDTPFARVGDEE